jgi:hypothetical protein
MQRVIRWATQEDLDQCVYIAGVFHEGSQFKDVTTYQPADAYNFAAETLNNPNRIFLVYEKEGVVVGFFIAGMRSVAWNDENVDRWDSFCHAIDFQRGGVYYKKVLKDAD